MTNAPSQAVLVRVGSLAVVVDGRCELVFPAEVYANYAYECRNADIPVALSCEDGLAPFRGTESLSVTEPGMLAQWASFPFSRRRGRTR